MFFRSRVKRSSPFNLIIDEERPSFGKFYSSISNCFTMKQKLERSEKKKFFPRYKFHIFTVSTNFIFHRKPWFFSFFPIPYYTLFFLIYGIKIFFCKCWFFRTFCKSSFSLRNFRTSAFSLYTRQTDTVLRINVSCKHVFLSSLSLQTVCRFSFVPNSLKNTFCSFGSTVLASCIFYERQVVIRSLLFYFAILFIVDQKLILSPAQSPSRARISKFLYRFSKKKKRKKEETGGNVAARSVIARQPWEKNAELRFEGIACRCGGQYRKTKNTKIDCFVRTLSLILKRLLQGEMKHRMFQNCTQ